MYKNARDDEEVIEKRRSLVTLVKTLIGRRIYTQSKAFFRYLFRTTIILTQETTPLKIFGGELVVETDCLPVIAMINNPDVIDATLLRWTAYIRLFNPIFVHIKGKDPISRKVPNTEEQSRNWREVETRIENEIDYQIKSVELEECPEKYRWIIKYLSTLQRPDGVSDQLFRKIRHWSYS